MAKNNNNGQEFAEALASVGGIIVGGLLVLGGLVAFVVGSILLIPVVYYLVGMLASVTFWGDWLVTGASKLGVTVAKGDLPVIFATLGMFGGFFRSNLKAPAKKKEAE